MKRKAHLAYFAFLFSISFLTIFLCVLISSLVTYNKTASEVEDLIREITSRELGSCTEYVETSVYQNASELYNTIIGEMNESSDLGYYLYNSITSDMMRAPKCVVRLGSMCSFNSVLDRMTLFYRSSERLLISNKTGGYPSVQYDLFYPFYDDELDWYDSLADQVIRTDDKAAFFVSSDSQAGTLCLARSFTKVSGRSVTIFLYYDLDEIIKHLPRVMTQEDTALCVFDRDRNLLFATDNMGLPEDLLLSSLETEGPQIVRNASQSYLMESREGQSGWIYISATPIQAYMQRGDFVIHNIFRAGIIALVIGSIMAALIAFLQLRPVKPVLRQMQNTPRRSGIYYSLNQTIDKSYRDLEQYRETNRIKQREMEQMRQGLYEGFILWFFTCMPLDKEKIRDKMGSISFPHKLFAAIAVKAVGDDRENCDARLDQVLMQIRMASEPEEAIISFCRKDEIRFGIINRDTFDESWAERLVSCCRDTGSRPYIYFSTTPPTESLAALAEAVPALYEALTYSFIYPERCLQTIPEEQPASFPSEEADAYLRKYDKSWKQGNKDECLVILGQLCALFREYPVSMTECRLYLISVIDIMVSLDNIQRKAMWELLDTCVSTEDFQRRLALLLADAEPLVRENSPSALALVQRAKKYIHSQMEQDMPTLSETAEALHISPSYLSHAFSQTGQGTFVDYVSQCRMEQVCKLLSTTDLTVTEISGKLGYSSPQYLRARFKQIMGMTPQEYRRASGQDEALTDV